MRVWLMIEGQEDVTWPQWVALAEACERHDIEGMFRSDHYGSVVGAGERGALDAWATIAALGCITASLRLGTLVSPATFRHPSVLARSVVTADHVTNGRVELGMGAGWNEQEHEAFGFPLPDAPTRLDVLEEQIEIVHRQWTDDEFDFDGAHYRLRGCQAEPKPVQAPHPPLLVGGDAGPRSAGIAAAWADGYNTIFADPDTCRRRRAVVEGAWDDAGRDPSTLEFSLMTTGIVGRDDAEVRDRVGRLLDRAGADATPDEYIASRRDDRVIGTVEQVVERLSAYEEAGVDRVMLQHLVHDDLDMVALVGDELAPAVA